MSNEDRKKMEQPQLQGEDGSGKSGPGRKGMDVSAWADKQRKGPKRVQKTVDSQFG